MPPQRPKSIGPVIDGLNSYCDRVERACSVGRLQVQDANIGYASALLVAASRWEAFLEDFLFFCVCGTANQKQSRRRLIEPKNVDAFRKMLLRGDRYLSMPTLADAKQVAGLYLKDSVPFSCVSDGNSGALGEMRFIRNAIAHESSYAIKMFRKKCPGVESLGPRRRFPGPYLRHEFRKNPSQRRIQLYFAAIKGAHAEIESAW